jgi:hypothetical protein
MDDGWSVEETYDGGFIISGSTPGPGGWADVLLLKVNSEGYIEWARNYGGDWYDVGDFVRQTYDGGYIVTGWTGLADILLLKTDQYGNLEWVNVFGSPDLDYGYCVQQTNDTGYVVAGYGWWDVNDYKAVLLKTDRYGNLLWLRLLKNYSKAFSVQQTTDGGYIVAGYTWESGVYKALLIKTDTLGETLWTRTYGTSARAYSVKETQDGGYILTGKKSSNIQDDVLLIKTDEFGNLEWQKLIGGDNDDVGNEVHQSQEGGFFVIGWTSSFRNGDWDLFLIRTDENGDTLWTKTYGGTGYDEGKSLDFTQDGGLIMVGSTASFGSGGNDVWILKMAFPTETYENSIKKCCQIWISSFSHGSIKLLSNLPRKQDVNLRVFNPTGREIISSKILLPPGFSSKEIKLRKNLANGIYFVILEGKIVNFRGKFVLLR